MKKLKKLNNGNDGYTLGTFACYCSCTCWWIGSVNNSQDSADANAGK